MSLIILQKQDLEDFIARLLPFYRVAGPVKVEDQLAQLDGEKFTFGVVEAPEQLRLDYRTTILPPKKFLLPPRETLFRFGNGAENGVKMAGDFPPTVIFGVHTCDLHAIQLLDTVFSDGHADPYYLSRRKNSLLVSLECLNPCDEQAFCKSMGTLTAEEGYDLHLIDLGKAYAVDAGTEAGRTLLRHAHTRLATQPEVEQLNAVLSEKWPKFPYRLDFDVSDLPALLNMGMKSPLWATLGERCLSCAACTNVCPTCYCFNVKDEVDLDLVHGERVRVWDSCQLDEFATVAGGHDFRKSRSLRQRHRFMRKGKYILEAFGLMGCVGCGRCARACLVNINPVTVFNELYRVQEGSH